MPAMVDDTPGPSSSGHPSDELLAVLYDELRRLARHRMGREREGHTLQPTALVHEAYLRLTEGQSVRWNSRGHFFGAAAEAMRRILVDQARRKAARKRGGDQQRVDADDLDLVIEAPTDDVLALDRALERLQKEDERKGQIVLLRYFAGLDREEAAEVLGISVRTLDREWRYILARLHRELTGDPGPAR
jgi:RNA polymerase sigma factor (TIGR02999 family)